MKKKNSLILDNEFMEYCELNNIKNPDQLAKKIFNQGFSIEEYGATPTGLRPNEKIVEKEVIKEIIKEVPIEKIVEVEKIIYKDVIKEVPVEVVKEIIKEVKIEVPVKGKTITKEVVKEIPVEVIKEVIKEVQVEKIVEITDTKEIDFLKEENKKLKDELEKISTSLSKLGKGKLMKNSNMTSLYDE